MVKVVYYIGQIGLFWSLLCRVSILIQCTVCAPCKLYSVKWVEPTLHVLHTVSSGSPSIFHQVPQVTPKGNTITLAAVTFSSLPDIANLHITRNQYTLLQYGEHHVRRWNLTITPPPTPSPPPCPPPQPLPYPRQPAANVFITSVHVQGVENFLLWG